MLSGPGMKSDAAERALGGADAASAAVPKTVAVSTGSAEQPTPEGAASHLQFSQNGGGHGGRAFIPRQTAAAAALAAADQAYVSDEVHQAAAALMGGAGQKGFNLPLGSTASRPSHGAAGGDQHSWWHHQQVRGGSIRQTPLPSARGVCKSEPSAVGRHLTTCALLLVPCTAHVCPVLVSLWMPAVRWRR